MCGIAGIFNSTSQASIRSMLRKIEHRGRDETIITQIDRLYLGMTRLAINDLSHGLYPMKYKHYLLIYNGEIYNYPDLRKKLLKQHVQLASSCDGEVILPLFDRYSVSAFSMLEGMFAIAIYDTHRQELLLIRDKAGEKPLYYEASVASFRFSSELKALVRNRASVAEAAVSEYLYQGYVSGQNTLISTVCKVPPAHYLRASLNSANPVTYVGALQNVHSVFSKTRVLMDGALGNGVKVNVAPYWNAPIVLNGRPKPILDLTNRLDGLIHQAVKIRLLSDVPLGCFLSGGIDSSLISCFTSQYLPHLNTYSVTYESREQFNERKFSAYVSQKIGSQHHEILCTPEKIIPLINNIGRIIDEPIIDAAVLPTYLLAQEARKSIKVVLTGEGADELFGGYSRYNKELLAYRLRHIIPFITYISKLRTLMRIHKLNKVFTKLSQHYASQHIWKEKDIDRLLLNSSFHQPKNTSLLQHEDTDPLLAMQLTDLGGFLSEQLLMKVDKMTMANNLESRAPFLDSSLIEFALNLPYYLKIHGGTNKYLVKKVAEKYFPSDFVWRDKQGFFVPLDQWFRHELKEYVLDSLRRIKNFQHMFQTDYYAHIVSEHLTGDNDHAEKIWGMIILLRWMDYHNIS